MPNNIAGSVIHQSPSFAQTPIDQLGLKPHLLNELNVRLDIIQVGDFSHQADLAEKLVYAKGILRGMEVTGAISGAQGLHLVDIFEKAYLKREFTMRHGAS